MGSDISFKIPTTQSVWLTSAISPMQFLWRNHHNIYKWTRQNALLSQFEHDQWLEKIKSDPSIKMFGIEDGQNCVGTAGLTSIRQDHGSAEFSLLIDPDKHGKGYGTAALIELLKYGFKHLRLNCIYGETFVGNPAIKMFRKLGMTEEGLMRQRYFKNGEYVDCIPISITRKEAEQQSWWR